MSRKKERPALTRREFLQEAGVIIGGSAVISIAGSSCRAAQGTEQAPKTSTPVQTAGTSAPNTISSPAPTTATSTPTTTASSPYVPYIPSTLVPALLPTPGCPSMVAADRVYSTDHVWAKNLSPNVAVLGISDKFQMLISNPKFITLPAAGARVNKDDVFGDIEGMKLNTDLICPVSGTVLDVNKSLLTLASMQEPLQPVIESPYISGWMIVVQLSKPDELKTLLSAEKYVAATAELH